MIKKIFKAIKNILFPKIYMPWEDPINGSNLTYNNTPAKHKNRVLTRAFKKAWELLETQTNLRKKYPDIILPDPNNPQNIPTTSNINKLVFEFPHS